MRNYKNIYDICSLLCGLPKNLICPKCFFFIGPMPVNLDRQSLIDIFHKEYVILEKSDGIRNLLFCDYNILSIIDRKLASHKILSNRISKKRLPTFLDGELTFNMLFEKYNYLIYDVGIISGDWRISSWDLYSRSKALKNFIIWLREDFYLKNNFFVKKLFFYKYSLNKLLQAVSLNVYTKEHIFLNVGADNLFHCNKNDGIIFSPLKLNYSLKTTCTIFKWKYDYENTMDFLIQTRIANKTHIKKKISPFSLACVTTKNKFYSVYFGKTAKLFSKSKKPILNNPKSIGEFRYIQRKGSWVWKKYRSDKINPNSYKVLINTLKIMSESINKFELIDNILKYQIRKERGKCCEKY